MRAKLLFLIIGLLLLPQVSQAGLWDKGSLEDMVAYPNAVKIDDKELEIFNVKTKSISLRSQDSIAKILDFYKKSLLEKGFWVDFANDDLPVLNFHDNKGRTITIAVYESAQEEGLRDIMIDLDLGHLEGTTKNLWQEKDSPGKDLSWLKRYPGSIRKLSTEDEEGGFMVAYDSTQTCFDCIVSHYRQQMLAKGWELIIDNRLNSKEAEEILKKEGQLDLSDSQIRNLTSLMGTGAPGESAFLAFSSEKGACIFMFTKQLRHIVTVISYQPKTEEWENIGG